MENIPLFIIKLSLQLHTDRAHSVPLLHEMDFLRAIRDGNCQRVKELLFIFHPMDINFLSVVPLRIDGDEGLGWTIISSKPPGYESESTLVKMSPLHLASIVNYTPVMKLLLAQPAIVVNPHDSYKQTPIMTAALAAKTDAVELLLRDKRTRLDDCHGKPFPVFAVNRGCPSALKCWIMCATSTPMVVKGDDLAELNIMVDAYIRQAPLINQGKQLLLDYLANPQEVRKQVEQEFKGSYADRQAAPCLALATFVVEGFLQLVPTGDSDNTSRFMIIITRLPPELQMILCHMINDSPCIFVARVPFAVAVRYLAVSYLTNVS